MVSADQKPLLTATGVVKHFPGAKALDGVDFDVLPGEVHCLLGQNGAGKSTLIKVLSGAHRPDAGTITWQGEEVSFPNPISALRAGVATIYQELDVIESMSVADNILLGHELSTLGWMRSAAARDRARTLLEQLGHPEISPSAEVGRLSAARRQIVAMARALSHNARLVIMDEPSSVLDTEEVDNLFRVIRRLTESGIGVVYISHRLEEVRRVGDRLTVLKDGRSTASGIPVAQTPTAEIVRLMIGHEGTLDFPPRPGVPADAPVVLKAEGLGLKGVFSEISFELRAGEILGLAGLVGSGRSEILETVYGARHASTGQVWLDGRRLPPGRVSAAVARGLGFCPEERKSQGLLLDEPSYKNVTLATFNRDAVAGWLRVSAEKAAAQRQNDDLQIVPNSTTRITRTYSGGNQQKLMLGRWLARGVRVLILDEPTRGVDVGARAEAYDLIRELAAEGVAILLVSSELEEVIGLADNILVINEGHIVARVAAAEVDEETVLHLILEGKEAA